MMIRGMVYDIAIPTLCRFLTSRPSVGFRFTVEIDTVRGYERIWSLDSLDRTEIEQLGSVQNPCWWMITADYTSRYIGDYNHPIRE